MKFAAAFIAILVLLTACAAIDQPAAGGTTSASAPNFSYPYNSPYW
jgi:hypothetical protein